MYALEVRKFLNVSYEDNVVLFVFCFCDFRLHTEGSLEHIKAGGVPLG